MIQVIISQEQKEQLFKEQFTYPHPRVMKKMWALYLKSFDLHNELICNILQINGNTLRSYFKDFNAGGSEKLKEGKFYRPRSDLQVYSGSIEDYFNENPPQSIGEAAAKIKELTGIDRKETQIRKFLKDLGFRHLKVGTVPAKALTEEKKRATQVFGRRLGAAIRRSRRWKAYRFFHGCRSLCLGRIYWVFVVFDKNIYAHTVRQKSIECFRRNKCGKQ
jgi:hypothetical protein